MAEKRVSVRLAAEGGRLVKAEFQSVGDAGEKSFRQISTGAETATRVLQRLAGIAGAAFSIRAMAGMAERYTEIGNTLRVLGIEHDQVGATIQRIGDIAQRTRSPLDAMATLYQRVSMAAGDMGASQADILRFTENIGLALAQQGGSAEQASGALLQLSQALGGGTVRAEEFNSILEGAFPIALAAARGIDEAGGSVAKLRNMVIEGKVSSDAFFGAILSQTEQLESTFSQTLPTISQAWQVLTDSITLFVGKTDAAVGASSTFAQAILVVAQNVGRLAAYAATFAAFMAGRWVAGFVAAAIATTGLSGALVVLRGALIRSGLGAVIVAAGELVYWLTRVGAAAASLSDAFWKVFEVGKAVFLGVGNTAWGLFDILAGVASGIAGSFTRAFAEIAKAWDGLVNGMAAAWNMIAGSGLGESMGLGMMGQSNVSGAIGAVADGLFLQGAESIRRGGRRITDAAKGVRDAMSASVAGEPEDTPTDALDDAAAAAARLDNALAGAGRAAGGAGKAGRGAGKEIKAAADDASIGWGAVQKSLSDYAADAANIGKGMGDALKNAFQSAESAFRNFVTRGKVNFRELIGSMVADLAVLQFKQSILGPLSGWLGGLLGGDPLTAALRAAGAPVGAGIFHAGGIVGAGGLSRTVPAMAFANAPRMHKGGWAGLKPDEVPAILQRGERVLSRRDAAGYGAGGNVTINVNVEGANGDQHVMALVSEGVRTGLSQYDRALPARLRSIGPRDR